LLFLLSGEATNTNFIVFGLTRPGLETTTYRNRGKHANYYSTNAVAILLKLVLKTKNQPIKLFPPLGEYFLDKIIKKSPED
jgi:hypothetical protein